MHTTPLTLQFSPEEGLVLFEWPTRVEDASTIPSARPERPGQVAELSVLDGFHGPMVSLT